MARLAVVAGNLQESLGAGLNEAIGPLSDGLIGLADSLGPVIETLGTSIGTRRAARQCGGGTSRRQRNQNHAVYCPHASHDGSWRSLPQAVAWPV
jgi:hypothetical protein